MEIQDYLVAAVQNITVLANHSKNKLAESNVQRVHSTRIQRQEWAYFYIDTLFRQFLMNTLLLFARYRGIQGRLLCFYVCV